MHSEDRNISTKITTRIESIMHKFDMHVEKVGMLRVGEQESVRRSKIEKVPRVIQGENSSKDTASSRNLVSTIGAQASPKTGGGGGSRCPEG